MLTILPPSRPKRDRVLIDAVLSHFRLSVDRSKACLIFIRGHYLNSMGQRGENDLNIYDDACFLVSPNGIESFNANTDPSFVKKRNRPLAKLRGGVFRFYKGKHRNKYWALRAYPEGVELDCFRNGVLSTARFINIHKGASSPTARDVTWSEGCLTIPSIQYKEFIARVYAEMDRFNQDTIPVILVMNRQTPQGQRIFDESGNQIT